MEKNFCDNCHKFLNLNFCAYCGNKINKNLVFLPDNYVKSKLEQMFINEEYFIFDEELNFTKIKYLPPGNINEHRLMKGLVDLFNKKYDKIKISENFLRIFNNAEFSKLSSKIFILDIKEVILDWDDTDIYTDDVIFFVKINSLDVYTFEEYQEKLGLTDDFIDRYQYYQYYQSKYPQLISNIFIISSFISKLKQYAKEQSKTSYFPKLEIEIDKLPFFVI